MKNQLLYLITVLIWGSTWFAIEFQLGDVAIEISLVYRFALAAATILIFCKLKGMDLYFSLKQHGFIALLGLLNFSLNYVMLYHAQKYLTSAMASIGFSLLLVVNIANTRIFFGKKIEPKIYFGAFLGIAGIVILFWPDVKNVETSKETFIGLGLIFLGIIFASLGNMISVRNSKQNLPVLQSSGWGMLYGTIFLAIAALINKTPFTISFKPDYLISLLYLSLFGTVIAFYSYFVLLKNIGPEKTSYSIVMFPVVAVILSSLFEGFSWNTYTLTGFIFVGLGNLIVLVPTKKLKRLLKIEEVHIKQPS